MKKVFVLVFVLFCIGILVIGGRGFMKGYRNATSVPADMATKPWTEKVTFSGGVVVDVPYPMTRQAVPIPDEAAALIVENTNFSYDRKIFYILLGSVTYKEEVEIDVDAGTEEAIAGLSRRPGFKISASKKHEITILGEKAIEVFAQGEAGGKSFVFRALFFTYQRRFFQMIFFAPKGNEPSAATWRRMRESIRFEKPAVPKSTFGSGVPGLPAGMRPRNTGQP